MREFGFELRVCARLESDGHLVARQLGTGVRQPGTRVADIVVVEPGPTFDARTAITPDTIPAAAIRADIGAGTARYWKDAFDSQEIPYERAWAIVERAVDAGFFELERRNGRDYIRQTARYPVNWFDRLIAVENKPDLDEPGDLDRQLRTDVALGLVDEVILATESYVTRAHRNRLPDPVGIWRRTDDGIEVVQAPTPLPADEPGIELIDRQPGRWDVEIVHPMEKARARRRIAERAYGKGWRTYDFPGCANIESARIEGASGLPHCIQFDRLVDPATECGPACPGFDVAEPPPVDIDRERASTSPWVAEPAGYRREQARLRRYE